MGDDEEIPAVVQDVPHVALNVAVAVVLRREQVARPRIMALFEKRIPDYAGELASDKYPQRSYGWPLEVARKPAQVRWWWIACQIPGPGIGLPDLAEVFHVPD
jgi:hypothetical protein